MSGPTYSDIPNELLDRIVALVLAPSPNDFGAIASLTLVSAQFRQVALRRYLRVLRLREKAQWSRLWSLLGAQQGRYAWVKVLHIPTEIIVFTPSHLISLTHLQFLTVDFEHEGLATQHSVTKRICKYLQPLINLTSLTLTSVPRIDAALLSLLARAFPGLTALSLSCTERLDVSCCWNCFQESASCMVHSPIPDMFSQAADLADVFANVLKPLTNLTHLHLGIFLSSENFFYSHLAHRQLDDCPPHAADECLTCYEHPYSDLVRDRELEASIIIAQKLKALRSVGWSTFFGNYESERQPVDGGPITAGHDWKRAITMRVLKKDGRVWVRCQSTR